MPRVPIGDLNSYPAFRQPATVTVEIRRDTVADCGNLNAIDMRTFSMTADVLAGQTQLLVFPEDSSFSFVVQ